MFYSYNEASVHGHEILKTRSFHFPFIQIAFIIIYILRWYTVHLLETATLVTNKAGQRVKFVRKQKKDEEVQKDRLVNLCVRRR